MKDEMINWQMTSVNTPEPNREIIAKNSTKVIFEKDSGSRCKITKFSNDDSALDIMEGLELHGFDLWAYTDEGDQYE